MACNSAKMFLAYVQAKGSTATLLSEDENESVVRCGWKADNITMDVYITFDADDTHVSIEGCNWLQISEDKFDKALRAANECNRSWRWVKFIVDTKHNQIIARDDAIIQLDSCAEEVEELVHRMVGIVDEAYPEFMKAFWA